MDDPSLIVVGAGLVFFQCVLKLVDMAEAFPILTWCPINSGRFRTLICRHWFLPNRYSTEDADGAVVS